MNEGGVTSILLAATAEGTDSSTAKNRRHQDEKGVRWRVCCTSYKLRRRLSCVVYWVVCILPVDNSHFQFPLFKSIRVEISYLYARVLPVVFFSRWNFNRPETSTKKIGSERNRGDNPRVRLTGSIFFNSNKRNADGTYSILCTKLPLVYTLTLT